MTIGNNAPTQAQLRGQPSNVTYIVKNPDGSVTNYKSGGVITTTPGSSGGSSGSTPSQPTINGSLSAQDQAKLNQLESQVIPVKDVTGNTAYYKSVSGQPLSNGTLLELNRLQLKQIQLMSGSTNSGVQNKYIEDYNNYIEYQIKNQTTNLNQTNQNSNIFNTPKNILEETIQQNKSYNLPVNIINNNLPYQTRGTATDIQPHNLDVDYSIKAETGGHYINPVTGLGYSSMYDLSKQGYIKLDNQEFVKDYTIPKIKEDKSIYIPVVSEAGEIIQETGISLVKGSVKLGEYRASMESDLLSREYPNKTITLNPLGQKLSNWSGYNKDIPAYADSDVQNLAITGGLTILSGGLLGTAGKIGGDIIYGGLIGKQTLNTISEPTLKNFVSEGLLLTPLILKGASYVKLEKLELPQETGEPANIKIFGLENEKGRAIPLISKTPEGYNFGTPNIREIIKNIPEGSDIKIGSALETKTILKNLRDIDEATPRAKEIIPKAQTIIKQTLKTNSNYINEELLYSSTERLPKEGVQEILDLAKEENGVLFGSKSRAFQLAQEYNIDGDIYNLIKVPRDIELRFDKYGESDLQRVTDKTITRLKNLGTIKEGNTIFDLGTAREIEGKPFTVEAKINDVYEKVAEFKGKEEIFQEEQVPETVIGFKKVGKTMKIGDIESTRLNEELRGVTQGTMRLTKREGLIDIYPPEKRVKDIGSVSVSARTLEMSNPNIKLKNAINDFESYYPEDLVREQIKKVLSEDEKIILADFRDEGSGSYLSGSTKIFRYSSPISEIPKSSPSVSPRMSEYNYVSDLNVSSSPSLSKSNSSSNSISNSQSYFSPESPSNSPSNSASPYSSASPSSSPSKSSSSSSSSSSSRTGEPPSTYLDFYEEKKRKEKHLKRLYIAQVRNKGKFESISEPVSKGEAYQIGERNVLNSLRATFRLLPTGIYGETNDIQPYVNTKIFRKPLPTSKLYTENTYIQKTRQEGGARKGRLSSMGEVAELKMSHKKSKKIYNDILDL